MKRFLLEIKTIREWIGVITGSAAVFGIAFGTVTYVDSRYTLATEFNRLSTDVIILEKRQSIDELKRALEKALSELYFYRRLLRENPNDDNLQKQVETLEEEVKYLKLRIREEEKAKREAEQ